MYADFSTSCVNHGTEEASVTTDIDEIEPLNTRISLWSKTELRGKGRSKLRWATSDVLSRKRQICVAIPLAPRSVRVKAADLDSYTGRDALRVRFQTARYDSAAPWSGRGCKSAWLQQYRQACKLRLAARAEAGWSGGAVLTIARAHPSELASPPPPAQCTAVHARAMPLVHIAA